MPKQSRKFRTPFGLNAWGLEQMKKYNAAQEESARYVIAAYARERRQNEQLAVDYEAQAVENVERLNALKKMEKSKKKLVFVTLNYNEKIVTPTGTVPYVMRILDHDKVTQGFAYWEWRDTEAETGLHTHIVLQGDTRRIVEMLKRRQGPYTELKVDKPNARPQLRTILKYPLKYWKDKCEYNEFTFKENKNELKSDYERLRKKYNLPNISK